MKPSTLRRYAGGLIVLGGLAVAGCEPQLDPEQYGKVVYELPSVPGGNLPYPLPQLDESPQDSQTEAAAEPGPPGKIAPNFPILRIATGSRAK